jgi:hypothetical protein
VLEHGPRAVMLPFGDPRPFAELIRRRARRRSSRSPIWTRPGKWWT